MRLDSMLDMWWVVLLYALAVNTLLYLLLGFVAAVLHSRTLFRLLLVPLASAIIGLLVGALLSTVPSLLVASLYRLVPSPMSTAEAAVIGCGQGIIIAMLSAGFFHRLL